ncbi:DUF2304 domain-containing protein [Compostimonas suwonensis]|uniref:DUF2304 domain-containing protein n=1 Tax=Compostimonas suwonensis TaxID=1048394 RepID=A0A2M9BV21_9MICO|nr:DUF2304 domain-containing protein [Compostimonas suwonensis]PJJ61732.1 hypothetical protein CLV54_2682 [Compostimonas suwonensis]
MNPVSYAFGIVAALIALAAVIEMMRRKRFRERHAFWWLLAAVLSLVIAIFPSVLEFVASALGIEVPANLAFFVSIVILFIVSVQHSAELTKLEDKTRVLAEHTALIEQRLDEVTRRLDDADGR